MRKKNYWEKKIEKYDNKYVAKHGRIRYLIYAIKRPKWLLASAIMYTAGSPIWVAIATLNMAFVPTLVVCMQYFVACLWLVAGICTFSSLYFYRKKAEEALVEFEVLEAMIPEGRMENLGYSHHP